MTRKIRIKRKRRPWLYNATKRNFAIGKLCLELLRPWARASAARSREAYEIARTARTLKDVELKEVTTSYRIEQARRTEILNLKTLLDLHAKHPGKFKLEDYGVTPVNTFNAENYE